MAALGALPAPRGRVMVREKKERAAETENNDWEEGSVKDGRWKREEVAEQRLFFNVWYRGTTRLSGRSTAEVEREAVEWAAAGARTLADVSDARGLLSEEAFRRRFPSLQTGTYQEILAEVPDAWKDLLRGTATAQHAGAREETEHARGLVMSTPPSWRRATRRSPPRWSARRPLRRTTDVLVCVAA